MLRLRTPKTENLAFQSIAWYQSTVEPCRKYKLTFDDANRYSMWFSKGRQEQGSLVECRGCRRKAHSKMVRCGEMLTYDSISQICRDRNDGSNSAVLDVPIISGQVYVVSYFYKKVFLLISTCIASTAPRLLFSRHFDWRFFSPDVPHPTPLPDVWVRIYFVCYPIPKAYAARPSHIRTQFGNSPCRKILFRGDFHAVFGTRSRQSVTWLTNLRDFSYK